LSSFGSSDRITVRGTWNNFAVQSVYDPTNLVSLAGGSEITSQNYIVHELTFSGRIRSTT
jgi:hypothetical protein